MKGVPVLGMAPGSPAEASGLRPARITPGGRRTRGDVIVSLGAPPGETSEDLWAGLYGRQAGDRVDVGILRCGRRMEIGVVLAEAGE